ncbi:MAG: L,D-transpeptidase [Rhizobiaceae bacterium]
MLRTGLAAAMLVIAAPGLPDALLTSEDLDRAFPDAMTGPVFDPLVADVQVVLDRAGVSPGVIDGIDTPRFRKALSTFIDLKGLPPEAESRTLLRALVAAEARPTFSEYALSARDVSGPFVDAIPDLFVEQARLPHLGYRSAMERVAESFHMHEDLLARLNPGVAFDQAGVTVRVADPGRRKDVVVARIVADKSARQVRAYDADGRLLTAYPASVGSADTPSPSGVARVRSKASNPTYTFNPAFRFQTGTSSGLVRVAAGPNNPVGSTWIGLDRPTYGIHGTPEPAHVGEASSHGCVRLTNWDADELARMTRAGTLVEFID